MRVNSSLLITIDEYLNRPGIVDSLVENVQAKRAKLPERLGEAIRLEIAYDFMDDDLNLCPVDRADKVMATVTATYYKEDV